MAGRRRDIVTIEKTKDCLALRRLGRTYSEIALECGMSVSYAYKLVRRAIAERQADSNELADQVIFFELERLDGMHAGAFPNACKGDPASIAACLRIQERRSRLLGLDRAPAAQLDVSLRRDISEFSDAELEAVISRARREEEADGEPHE